MNGDNPHGDIRSGWADGEVSVLKFKTYWSWDADLRLSEQVRELGVSPRSEFRKKMGVLTTHIRRMQDYCYQFEPIREFIGPLELLTKLVEEMQAANDKEQNKNMVRRPLRREATKMQNSIVRRTP
jgi:hypothetical protein